MKIFIKLYALPNWALSILSGVIIGIAFPPTRLGFAVWVGIIPFIIILERSTQKQIIWNSIITGFISSMVALYWLAFNVGATPWLAFLSLIGATLIITFYWFIFGVAYSIFQHRWGVGLLSLPFLWTTREYLQSFGTFGFPWISIATTQTPYLPLIQMVEYTGIYGVTFFILLLNIIGYKIICVSEKVRYNYFKTWMVVFILPWVFGYVRLCDLKDEIKSDVGLTISLVQPNIGPLDKWTTDKRREIFTTMDSLYRVAATEKPDLIVWPEAAVPSFLQHDYNAYHSILAMIQEHHIPLLTGALDWRLARGGRSFYNSAFFISDEGIEKIYHKIKLVPFGEYVPFVNLFPRLNNLNFGMGGFHQGKRHIVFHTKEVPFMSLVCFESVFPQFVRKFIQGGAKLIISLDNDGWYGETSGAYQHSEISRFRAIEFRTPVVRCTNTGISSFVDATGNIVKELPLNTQGTLTSFISTKSVRTIYERVGDLFALLNIFILGGIIFYQWFRKQ